MEALNPVIIAFRDGGAVLAGLSLGAGAMEVNRLQFVAACAALPGSAGVRPAVDPACGQDARARSRPPDTPRGASDCADEATLCEIEAQIALLRQLRGSLKATAKTKTMDAEAYATARELFDALKAAWEGIAKWAEGWTPDQERRSQQLAGAGLQLLACLWARYERLKRERAALDFSDLQRLTRDLLRDHPAWSASAPS